MSRLKLMTIIGTRPEIIRLSVVIKKCDRYFDQILVHTGQNYDYELNQVFFDDLGLRAPDFYLDAVGADLGEMIGNIIAKSYSIMVEQQPDALLILGDTNSCLSAIAAKRLHIPIFHMEAGNRCKDECLPEETNRRIVDIISDVNLAYSEHARRYLHECGLPKERTYVTGSPMAEVLHANLEKIETSDIHQRLGLENPVPLETDGVDEAGRPYGIGRVGSLPGGPLSLADFARKAKENLGLAGIRAMDAGVPVHRVAVGGGACGSMLPQVKAMGCDTFLTSDLKHDLYLEARDLGINLLDAGHYSTEAVVCPVLAQWVREAFPALEVLEAEGQGEVFGYF